MKSKRVMWKRLLLLKLFIGFVVFCGVFVLAGVLVGNHLVNTEYSFSSERVQEDLCIVHITDLHAKEFGEENEELLAMVQAQKPDLIFLTGDLVNANDADADVALALICNLVELAPVYCSLGNHEIAYQNEHVFNRDGKTVYMDGETELTMMTELYAAAGATVLEKNYVDVEVKGVSLRIGGLYGYALPDDNEDMFGEQHWYKGECEFLRDFCDTDRAKMLLCHMPVSWIIYGSLDSWKLDYVFAGHAHGGQIRLPFIGGLYAPDQGFFPGKLEGVFDSKDGKQHMILSRGLGSSRSGVPRLFNSAELVTVRFVPVDG